MNRLLPALVCVTLTLATGSDDQPYCALRYRRLCQGKGRHVGCQFSDIGPGIFCVNYRPITFHDDLKNFITHYINRRRHRIATGSERVRGGLHLPKPEIMMMVEWDRELASLAQRLADQCSFVHDECRATVRYPYAGQTVGEVRWRRSSDSDALTAQRAIRRVFDAWWGERRRVQPQQLTAPFRMTAKGAVWGHFSQLAVWTLRAVGCGAVRHGTDHPRLLLVCDFSHTNMLGQRTISPGPMRPCPIHTERRPRSAYPLLCAPVRRKVLIEYYETEDDQPEALDDEDDSLPEDTTKGLRNVTRARVEPVTSATKRTRGHWRSQVRANSKVAAVERLPDDVAMDFRSNFLRRMNVDEEILQRKTTKGILMEKLDNALEGRLKAQHKYLFHDWEPRSMDPDLAEEHRDIQITEPYTIRIKDLSELPVRRTTALVTGDIESEGDFNASFNPLNVKHKWQQTRHRPLRPGASALLKIPVTEHTRPQPMVAMMLDKEDVDQLFRDTGFNPNWLRQRQ